MTTEHTINGLYVGEEIKPLVYADNHASGRWLITKAAVAGETPRRIGEVMGGHGTYLACKGNGEQLGKGKTLLEAVEVLEAASALAPKRAAAKKGMSI